MAKNQEILLSDIQVKATFASSHMGSESGLTRLSKLSAGGWGRDWDREEQKGSSLLVGRCVVTSTVESI